MKKILQRIKALLLALLLYNRGLSIATVAIGIAGLVIMAVVVAPAYMSPKSRMYTSSLGYGAMKRNLNLPFDVKSAEVKRKRVIIPYLGEGIVSGEPIRVPLIPLATITKVHVKEGDQVKKGELLLELEDTKARRNLAAAELALATVEAELKRVEGGSAFVLIAERPEQDKIELEAAKKELIVINDKLASLQDLIDKGIAPAFRIADMRKEKAAATARVESAELSIKRAESGVSQSLLIAQNAVEDARQNVEYRKVELEGHKIYAPRDGLISAVLVREGEFNQDLGKPAFLLTAGLWFEGFFDQAVLSRVKPGMKGSIFLEAFPGREFPATVAQIIPQVTFATGGPEINRPMRPRGTGAPEWAATFSVRFSLDNPGEATLGMTGNVKLIVDTEATVIHRNALLSIAAGRAIVIQEDEIDGQWLRIPIETGYIGHKWAEVKNGLKPGTFVLADGHRILREGDQIRSTVLEWSTGE